MKPSIFITTTVLVCISLLIFSCKKNSDKPNYDITYTGNLLLGDSIIFQSNAPANSTLLWLFSDGVSSNEILPIHSFQIYRLNTVTLIVNKDSTHTITKTLQFNTGVQKIAGTWNWTGGYKSGSPGGPLNDTSFTITILNDTAISVWGEHLMYTSANPNNIQFTGGGGPLFFIWYSNRNDTIYFEAAYGGSSAGTYIRYYKP